MSDVVQADNRPLLERGCPICGEKLKRTTEISGGSWAVFAVFVLLGLFFHWVFFLIALPVPLAGQAKIVKCGCGFKQKIG